MVGFKENAFLKKIFIFFILAAVAYLEGVGESQWAGVQWTVEQGVDIRR